MEEQLQQYLKEFVATLKEGGNFAMEQLPLFIQEYLTYYTVYHAVISLFLLVSLATVIYAWYKFNKSDGWDGEFVALSGMVVLIPVIPLSFGFIENLFNFLKVTLAPRLYLVENLLELVN